MDNERKYLLCLYKCASFFYKKCKILSLANHISPPTAMLSVFAAKLSYISVAGGITPVYYLRVNYHE